MNNTACEKCYFSNTVDSDHPCKFNIIEQIKDTKEITVKNNFYYINEYSCRYGISKDTINEHQKVLKDINIEEYIISKNTIKYYLIINYKSEFEAEKLCNMLNSLPISPQFVSILTYDINPVIIIKDIKEHMSPQIKWKAHNFLDPNMSFGKAAKVALDTKHNLFDIPYLWLLSAENLSYALSAKAIEKINYIVNIQQPVCNFVTSNKATGINDLFINSETYHYLTKFHLAPIDTVIENIDTSSIYYD